MAFVWAAPLPLSATLLDVVILQHYALNVPTNNKVVSIERLDRQIYLCLKPSREALATPTTAATTTTWPTTAWLKGVEAFIIVLRLGLSFIHRVFREYYCSGNL